MVKKFLLQNQSVDLNYKKISKSLEKSALIMEVDGELKDLSYEINKDSKVRLITSKDKEGSRSNKT